MPKRQINENTLLESIWFQPTATLSYILKNNFTKYVTILLVLGGIARAIDRAATKNMGDTMDTWLVISIAVFTGGLFGWIGYYIYAWALSETGKWLDGKASSEKIRTVIAWSLVPAVVALLLIIPELVILGDDLFKSEMGAYPQLTIYVIYFFGILEIVLSIWSIVILVAGLKVVQSFGTGKAILNLILPALVIAIPIAFVVVLLR